VYRLSANSGFPVNAAGPLPAPLPFSGARAFVSLMPRSEQRTVTLSRKTYTEIQRITQEHAEDFDGVSDYVKHAVVELNMRMRQSPGSRRRP
jgi:hypothetical protein